MHLKILSALCLSASLAAQDVPTANAQSLPVQELTAFKDGHAYIVRESSLAGDANGLVVLDQLPVPVLGTFWPYATGGASVVSARCLWKCPTGSCGALMVPPAASPASPAQGPASS